MSYMSGPVTPDMEDAARLATERLVRRFRLPEQDRDDLYNMGLAAAWRADRKQDDQKGDRSAFLYRCAFNGAMSHLRREFKWRQHGQFEDGYEPPAAPGEEVVERLPADVIAALSRIPPSYQHVIRRRYLDGIKRRELAVELGLSYPVLTNRLKKAMLALRRKLGVDPGRQSPAAH